MVQAITILIDFLAGVHSEATNSKGQRHRHCCNANSLVAASDDHPVEVRLWVPHPKDETKESECDTRHCFHESNHSGIPSTGESRKESSLEFGWVFHRLKYNQCVLEEWFGKGLCRGRFLGGFVGEQKCGLDGLSATLREHPC